MVRVRLVAMVVVAAVLAGCPTTPDVCENVDCGSGRCVVDRGAAACWCDDGFLADGLSCVPAAVDPCASNPCAGESASVCVADGGEASCVCPADRIDVDGGCVLRSACVPNPCGAVPHQSVCELVDGGAQCLCEPGYAPEDGGCATTPAWTCDGPVHGAPGSPGEPDDCPPQATALTAGAAPLSRELRPAGDEDWFSLPVQSGHVYEFSTHVTGGVTSVLLEAFDPQGFTLLAADTRGGVDASVRFPGPATSPVLVRVRPLNPAGTCSYEVQFVDALDDWPNVASAASLQLMPGARFEGEVQFVGDVDVVKLAVPANTAVRLSMPRPDGGAAPDLAIDVWSADGGASRRLQWEETVVAFPQDETMVLVAQGRTSQATGRFALQTENLGPDDFSDDRAFAQVVTTIDAPVSASFERAGDLDSIVFEPDAGSYYRLSCDMPGDAGCGVTVRVGTHVVTSGAAPLWRNDYGLPLHATFSGADAGDYSFTLTNFGPDDHGFSPGTPVTVGTPVAGRLEETADVDGFRFSAQARHLYQIDAASPGPTLQLELYNTTGNRLAYGASPLKYFSATAADYRVLVRAPSGASISMLPYVFTVNDIGQDVHGDTLATASPITLGQPETGTIEFPGDADWLTFPAVAGRLYRVRGASGNSPFRFHVYEPGGQELYGYLSSYGDLVIYAATTGAYAVLVDNFRVLLGNSWTVTVTDEGPEDHGSTAATATLVSPLGTPVAGSLGYPDDVDVLRFDAVATHIYRITPIVASVYYLAHLELKTATGQLLPVPLDYAANAVQASSTGPLYVWLRRMEPEGDGPSYSVTIEDVGLDDVGGTDATGMPIGLGTPTSGVIQFEGDKDTLLVSTTPRHIYRVVRGTGSYRLVVRAGSTVLTSGVDAPPLVKAPSSLLSIDLAQGTLDERWTVTVTDVGTDDHGDDLASATPLVLGAAATAGELEFSNDIDAFSVGAAANDIVHFRVTTSDTQRRRLVVRDVNGVSVFDGEITSATFEVGVRASAAGTLEAEVRPVLTDAPGAYGIQAIASADDFGNGPSTAAPLTLGTPVSGVLDYVTDTDVFSLPLTTGPWSLNIQGGATATLFTPTGTFVTSTTSSVVFPSSTAGLYVVQVSGLSVPATSYVLRVE